MIPRTYSPFQMQSRFEFHNSSFFSIFSTARTKFSDNVENDQTIRNRRKVLCANAGWRREAILIAGQETGLGLVRVKIWRATGGGVCSWCSKTGRAA